MGFYKNQLLNADDELRIIYKSLNNDKKNIGKKYKRKEPKKIIFFEYGKMFSQTRNVKDIKHLTKWDGQTQLTFVNGEKFIVRDDFEELARQL